jgi:hypothetical protein
VNAVCEPYLSLVWWTGLEPANLRIGNAVLLLLSYHHLELRA